MKYFKKRRRLEWIELCAWENLYWERHPGFLRSKKGSFLSTGSFFQTLGKFNHQTFKKGLIQNAVRASQKESVGVNRVESRGFFRLS